MYKLIILISFIFLNAFGEALIEAEKPSSSTVFSGSFSAVGGNNYTNGKSTLKQQEFNGFIEGALKVQNSSIFSSKVGDEVKYGFAVEGVINSTNSLNPFNINEATFRMSLNKRGTRVVGFQNSVASKIRVDSTTFNPNSGGINGSWQKFLLFPVNGSFLTSQGMMIENGFSSPYFLANSQNIENGRVKNDIQPFENWSNSNFGLSYVGDRINGFRFGISYFMDNKTNLLFQKNNLSDKKNIVKDLNSQNDTFLKDIISTGFNYYNGFNDFEFAFSFGYETAKTVSKEYDLNRLNSYSAGLNLSYLGVTLGGSFTYFGKSMRINGASVLGNNAFLNINSQVKEARDDYIFDVGLGYAILKNSISVSYIKSSFMNNVFWAGVISFETKPTENLVNYIQLSRYQFTNANEQNSNRKNSGFVINLGLKYMF